MCLRFHHAPYLSSYSALSKIIVFYRCPQFHNVHYFTIFFMFVIFHVVTICAHVHVCSKGLQRPEVRRRNSQQFDVRGVDGWVTPAFGVRLALQDEASPPLPMAQDLHWLHGVRQVSAHAAVAEQKVLLMLPMMMMLLMMLMCMCMCMRWCWC